MDITKWTAEQVLGVPDWCFGRRWIVGWYCYSATGVFAFDISEATLPDKGVLWELVIWSVYSSDASDYVRVGLGSRVPGSEAEFMTLRPLMRGIGLTGPEPRMVVVGQGISSVVLHPRSWLEAQGQKLVVCAFAPAAKYLMVHVWAVVSSLPREVPDWVFSGQVRRQ